MQVGRGVHLSNAGVFFMATCHNGLQHTQMLVVRYNRYFTTVWSKLAGERENKGARNQPKSRRQTFCRAAAVLWRVYLGHWTRILAWSVYSPRARQWWMDWSQHVRRVRKWSKTKSISNKTWLEGCFETASLNQVLTFLDWSLSQYKINCSKQTMTTKFEPNLTTINKTNTNFASIYPWNQIPCKLFDDWARLPRSEAFNQTHGATSATLPKTHSRSRQAAERALAVDLCPTSNVTLTVCLS